MSFTRVAYVRENRLYGGRWGVSSIQKRRLAKELLLLIASLMAVSLFYVWSRIQVIEKGYRLSDLRKEQKELEELNRTLELETATLKAPERLETIGRTRFGLTRPQSNQVIFLTDRTERTWDK